MITLTVDGNPEDLSIISGILSNIDSDGDHIRAENGSKALKVADQYQLDVVFINTELPDSKGIEIAEKILLRQSETNIVFVTRDASYAVRAFGLFASGYLMKPVSEQDIRSTMRNLRYSIKQANEKSRRLEVRCFGTFEAFVNGIPITFERAKTKQLLAYLIDRQGDLCDIPQMVCALWPESDGGPAATNYLRRLISHLQSVLNMHGVGEAIIRSWGKMGINKTMVDCDYYDYLEGKPEAVSKFKGEYMSQYSMGEMTLASLVMGQDEIEQDTPEIKKDKKLTVKCFGNFEVDIDDEPLIFSRRKSRELFAFLIGRQGAPCFVDEIVDILREETEDHDSAKHIFRTLLYELRKSLDKIGMEDVIIKEHRQLALRRDRIDCDFWKLLSGDRGADGIKPDRYLREYAWAEPSREMIRSLPEKIIK